MFRKIKHVTALTALLAASSEAVTIQSQPNESDLANVAIEDLVDTTHLALREGADAEVESYGSDAPKTVQVLLDTMKDIAFTFKDPKLMRAVQEFAQVSGVLEILINYLTTKPSKEEKSILKQLKKVTEIMIENQKMIDGTFKRMHKNVKFMAKNKDIALLDTMVHSQIVRGNMYRDNNIVFHCGEGAHLCKEAFERWTKSLEKQFNKTMKNGNTNRYGSHRNLGYNLDVMSSAFAYAMMQLQSFSTGIMLADAGSRAWENRMEDPDPKSPIPSVTLDQQRYADFVSNAEETAFNHINSKWPYLMQYSKHTTPVMGYGDKPREGRHSLFLKGMKIGKGTYVNDIQGMLWGQASGGWTHTETVDCKKALSKKKGMCSCPANTWMRGQKFPDKKANRYLNGWEKSYCNHMQGYFHTKCSNHRIGKNKWATCPANKYMVGIGRGGDSKGTLSNGIMKCCELDYHHPVINGQKIPERYYTIDKKYVAFRTSEKLQYVDSQVNKGHAYLKENGFFQSKAMLKAIQMDRNDQKMGFFRFQTTSKTYWSCYKGKKQLYTNGKGKNSDDVEFSLIEHNDDVVIYHPHSQRFIVQNPRTKRMECASIPITKAQHFKGPKIPHKDIHHHMFYPELFRTSETVGTQKGWGWEPNAISPWFSFYHKRTKSFLAGDNKGLLKYVPMKADNPGPWEKWRLEKYERDGQVVWGMKHYLGKYLVCEQDKRANANRTKFNIWEYMQFFRLDTGKLVIYNPYWGRYIRIVGKDVKCDTEDPKKATWWESPELYLS